ncbi:GlxA family transcriptional regulator [Derxia lacustris]|uniref:GlxA family transcriptional regulator n=1 Tax=Derxia lacustris TaxID=764842 RepID=UPI000A1777C0|nr:GlxA family transcriptional regulator [Derxia lacustris]
MSSKNVAPEDGLHSSASDGRPRPPAEVQPRRGGAAADDAGACKPVHVAFVTLPRFTMIAFSSAIEALRMANYVSRRTLYRWSIITPDGQPASASNGLALSPCAPLDPRDMPDVAFVVGGVDVREAVTPAHLSLLQTLGAAGVKLGSLCTGAYALVRAGLMNGHRCAIHWENLAALQEEFPRVSFTTELFVIDADRYTCTGGSAPLDLMIHLIGARFGDAIAAQISEQFVLERVRDSRDQQHMPMVARVGYSRKSLVEVAALMEANIEEPLSLEDVARLAGLSQRQLQRLFKHFLGVTPTQYYLNLRLRRARELLLQTDMTVTDITVACGFQSTCHFSKCYRCRFGYAPSTERRRKKIDDVRETLAQPGHALAAGSDDLALDGELPAEPAAPEAKPRAPRLAERAALPAHAAAASGKRNLQARHV